MDMPCPHCGAEVNVRAKVCAACGKRVKEVGGRGKLLALALGGFILAVVGLAMLKGPAP